METVLSLARRVNSSVGALLLDSSGLRLETTLNLLHLASQMDPHAQGAEAAKLVDAAQALLPDMPADLRIRAALVRSRVAIHAMQYDEAARWADEAQALAKRHRFANLLGMALALRGEVEVRNRKFAAALPLLEEAAAVMQRSKSARTDENVRALISLGTTRAQLGQVDRAQRAFKRALELSTRLRLDALRGKALTGLGLVAWTRRQLDAAVTFLTQAQEAFARVEDLHEASRVLTNLGLVRREQGRPDEALAALEQALRIQERLDAPRDRSATLDEIAAVYLALGRHADASRAVRRAIKEAQAGRDQAREAACQVTLARVLRAQGRRGEAIEMLRGAVSSLARLGVAHRATTAAGELGLLLREAGAEHEAVKYLAMALQTPAPEAARGPQGAALQELPT
ncbi:MAG: tetratricopeptide repeat protein [Armatimonadota bacterium]|nr:tetratricopeptide repeat protein [Armatimonadota bacterium]